MDRHLRPAVQSPTLRFDFLTPARVVFGWGRRSGGRAACPFARASGRFVVSGSKSLERSGVVAQIKDLLEEAGLTVVSAGHDRARAARRRRRCGRRADFGIRARRRAISSSPSAAGRPSTWRKRSRPSRPTGTGTASPISWKASAKGSKSKSRRFPFWRCPRRRGRAAKRPRTPSSPRTIRHSKRACGPS